MASKTIETTCPKNDNRKVTVEYDFGESLDDSVALFGEEVVHSAFVRSSIITLQANVRRMAEDNENTDEAIQESVRGWKPGVVRRSGKSKQEKAAEAFSALTPEEQKEVIAMLKAQK